MQQGSHMTELCDLSAVELSRRIARRDISPVEVLDSCLTRIEAVNPTLNAVVAADEGEARKAAKAAGPEKTKKRRKAPPEPVAA